MSSTPSVLFPNGKALCVHFWGITRGRETSQDPDPSPKRHRGRLPESPSSHLLSCLGPMIIENPKVNGLSSINSI